MKVNRTAYEHARRLIKEGHCVLDQRHSDIELAAAHLLGMLAEERS